MYEVYWALNKDTKSWWYHRQLRAAGRVEEARKFERRQIRMNVEHLRQTCRNSGYLSIGTYGWTLHMGKWHTLSGYAPDISGICIAAKLIGIPVIDKRTVRPGLLLELVHVPMVGLEGDVDEPPYHGFSYAPLEYVAERYRELGATLYNFERPGEP